MIHDAPTQTLSDAIRDVTRERRAQDIKWGEQNHPNGTGHISFERLADLDRRLCELAAKDGTVTWRHILQEEISEAFAEKDPSKLRTKLIQVAAVAIAWAEAIDRAAGGDR